MSTNGFAFSKVQAIHNRSIISIALLNIRMASGKVSREETKASVMIVQSYPDSTLVSRHATKTCLHHRVRESNSNEFNSYNTLRDVPSTFLITDVSSSLTRTINAVPTSYEANASTREESVAEQ